MSKRDRSRSAARRRDSRRRALALGAVAAAATAGFVALNAAVVRRETAEVDEAARKAIAADPDSTVHEAAEAVKKVGKWYTYIPGATLASAGVLAAPGRERDWRSRGVGAGAVMLAAAVATALNPTFDKVLPQPPAPPGHPDPNKPVFPSGHAFGPTTIAFGAAYVLSREEIAHPAVAFPVAAVVPLLTAGPRMLVQKHWLSDVAGGVLGGIAVAAACLAGYEAARG